MSDIFVSYASADRERARSLAEALTARGWSVWWDRTIPPGKEFDQVIEEALDAARCVVVLWSRASTASTWVKTEAADAMRRKILVPALIDDTKIPLEFRRLQAADLADWEGQAGHEEFEHLCRSIDANLRGHVEPISPPPLPKPSPPRHRRVEPPPAPPPYAQAPAPASRPRATLVLAGAAGVIAIVALGGFLVSEYVARVRLERQLGQLERTRIEQQARGDAAAGRQAGDDRNAGGAGNGGRSSGSQSAPTAGEDRLPSGAEPTSENDRPARRTLDVSWNDASLRYSGTLVWGRADAALRFTAYDTPTGTPLGQFTFPADPPSRSPYLISGVVPVSGDSTTPGPHQHTVTLHFEVEDGVPRLIENCQMPGVCYPAGAAAN